MNLSFENKTVLITGGIRGIGSAIALNFADTGADVIITGTKKIDKLKSPNILSKKNIKYYELDYLSDQSIELFFNKINSFDIDILINNAGINKIQNVIDVNHKDWDMINKVNLRGPFLMIKNIAKKMKKQKSGKIINIASIFGVVSKKKRSVYSSTKWGLIGLTKTAALELAPFNVQVNALSPGFVDTELTQKILGQKNIKKIIKSIPQGRLAKVDEIAKAVLFLCSDYNTYITGQNIIIDGGFTSA